MDPHTVLSAVKSLSNEIADETASIKYVASDVIVPRSILSRSRQYIKDIANQVNGTYENGWYDGCFVMMRRLMETLLIECFEAYGCADAIKSNNDYRGLGSIIGIAEARQHIPFSRGSLKTMKQIKHHGDNSAHNRWYTASKIEVDDMRIPYRVMINELTEIADM